MIKKIFIIAIIVAAIIVLSISIRQYISYIRNGNLALTSIYNVYGNNTFSNNGTDPSSPVSNVIKQIKNVFVKAPIKIQRVNIPINRPDLVKSAVSKFSCLRPDSQSLSEINKNNTLSILFDTSKSSASCNNLVTVTASNPNCTYQVLSGYSIMNRIANKIKGIKYNIQKDTQGICGMISTAESVQERLLCTSTKESTKDKTWNIEYLDSLRNYIPGKGITQDAMAKMHKDACPDKDVKCDTMVFTSNYVTDKESDLFINKYSKSSDKKTIISSSNEDKITDVYDKIRSFLEEHKNPNNDCSLQFQFGPGLGHTTNIRSSTLDGNKLNLKIKNTMYQGDLVSNPESRYTDIAVNVPDDTLTITLPDKQFDGGKYDYKSGSKIEEKKRYITASGDLEFFMITCCYVNNAK